MKSEIEFINKGQKFGLYDLFLKSGIKPEELINPKDTFDTTNGTIASICTNCGSIQYIPIKEKEEVFCDNCKTKSIKSASILISEV